MDRKYRQSGYQDNAPSTPRGPAGPFDDRPARLEGAPRGRSAGRPSVEVFRCRGCGEKNDPAVAPAALCVKCKTPLHACAQCRHFDGGAQFQCRQPIPVPISAKSRANECTFYEPAVTLDLTGRKATDTPDQARSAFDKLFGKKP
ncbi:MAG: hypothetical protein IPP07_10965 [Holophagales bacterium]|nr:hypothetical protein [Holophagales bacterium]